MEGGKDIATTTSDAAGKFHFTIDHAGRYAVRAEAKTFACHDQRRVFAEPRHDVELSLTLSPSVVAAKYRRNGHRLLPRLKPRPEPRSVLSTAPT